MTPDEFHKRATSYIKPIGAEQERKLKEFIVSPPSAFHVVQSSLDHVVIANRCGVVGNVDVHLGPV